MQGSNDPDTTTAKGGGATTKNMESMNLAPATGFPSVAKGEVQPEEYRDVHFAIAFVVQLVGIISVAVWLGPAAVKDSLSQLDQEPNNNGSSNEDSIPLHHFMLHVSYLFIGACLLTMGALKVMTSYPKEMVTASFFFAPLCFGIVTLASFAAGDDIGTMFAMVTLILSCMTLCFYFFFRKHMAFAASNLHAALSCIRLNNGLYILSLGTALLVYAWVMVWMLAFGGILFQAESRGQVPCESLGDDDTLYPRGEMCDEYPPSQFGLVLMMLCLFWGQQVLQNVLHTTTAGTVGAWWANPMGDPSLFSIGIRDSLRRSLTYSFGSICLGSLLVAMMQVLNQLARDQRNRRGESLLFCIIECLLRIFRSILEYVNSWAFVYVGLYGYDYINAGKKVLSLFQNRGWMTYISDRLVFRVLMLLHLGIGALTGCLGILLDMVGGTADSHVLYFFIGFMLGLIISSTALFVVESAVRSIIVCYAEDADTFKENHPGLCQAMEDGWQEAYPTLTVPQSDNSVV